jgi:hypothetical protein
MEPTSNGFFFSDGPGRWMTFYILGRIYTWMQRFAVRLAVLDLEE